MELKISNDITVDADDLVTARTCVIGQSGSGKSYAIAVMCEELAKNNIGFCIIDTEGEYFSLKEKYPLLWVGSDSKSEIDIKSVNYNNLAKKIISKNFPVIFDVSELDDAKEKLGEFLRALYKVGSKAKQPYLVIIEEIDKFAPQRGDVLPEITELSQRGRKRGLGLLVATQRPALVNKNILSQCGNQIIGKLAIRNDVDAVKLFFPDKNNLEKLPFLKPGQFFIQGEIADTKLIQIRKRETPHKAITPKLIGRKNIQTKDLEEIEAELKEKTNEEPDVDDVSAFGLVPKISQDEAFKKIKKGTKRFKFFGSSGLVSGLHLVLKPIFSCEIKYLKKKLIGHEFLTVHTYFDALTGDVVSLEKGISSIYKTSEFLGLSSNDLEIFNVISRSRRTSTTEIAHKIKKSPEAVRISLKELSKRNLINAKRVGRNIVYYAFTKTKLPSIDQISKNKAETNKVKLSARKFDPVINSNDLSAFIRSLSEKADVVTEKIVYYPFYKATVIRKDSSKEIFVDAVTGKIVKFAQ